MNSSMCYYWIKKFFLEMYRYLQRYIFFHFIFFIYIYTRWAVQTFLWRKKLRSGQSCIRVSDPLGRSAGLWRRHRAGRGTPPQRQVPGEGKLCLMPGRTFLWFVEVVILEVVMTEGCVDGVCDAGGCVDGVCDDGDFFFLG